MAKTTMQRRCFLLKIRKDRVEDYLKAHDVWPEMRAAIRRAGIRNYSLFIHADGFAVGYFEAEDPAESLAKLARTEVSKRWEGQMCEFFEGGIDDAENGAIEWLDQYFYNE